MIKNERTKAFFDVAWYIVLFIIFQLFFGFVLSLINKHFNLFNESFCLAASSMLSSVTTIAIFCWRRYTPVGRTYLKSDPWLQLVWVCLMALGLILPLEWIYEEINVQLPADYEHMFESLLGNPWGYMVIGILAPVAEEMVFRGAILRRLLNIFSGQNYWWAIVVSAFLFGLIHLNFAQGINAFLIGLILGWMYFRTKSIVPGIAFHWINNTVAYIMYKIMPDMADGKLIDLFHGDGKTMALGIVFSMLIFIPSLLQVIVSMRKKGMSGEVKP